MVAIADINGDGNSDLVVNIPGTTVVNFQLQNQFEIFLGNGDGTFKTPMPIYTTADEYGTSRSSQTSTKITNSISPFSRKTSRGRLNW